MNEIEAPTPPRWFEFLLEPGRLQQHLEMSGNDPTPLKLITSEKLYSDIGDQNDVIIPNDSYEAKYRLRKSYALQTLSIKVASYLDWPLDMICTELTIPTQYKLMQALASACSSDKCPPEVKQFATVIHCHWFLKSAITYRLSTLQPQSSSTTIIYLSQLQQQQQTADNMALMSMGELFANNSKELKSSTDKLHEYIWELAKGKGDGGKRRKASHHPFEKANLSRPKMECFDLTDEDKNDWKQCVPIEPFKFIEAACYDLGRYFFFEESYSMARETFEIIKDSKDRYPLLDEYLKSAKDMLSTDGIPVEESVEDGNMDFCDKLNNDIYAKRKATEKYLFDCMTEFAQSKRKSDSSKSCQNGHDSMDIDNDDKNDGGEDLKEDCDLRFEQQALACQQRLGENTAWYLQVPIDNQQKQLLEIGKGDMFMSRGNYKQAMGCFVGALMIMTDYFTVFSKNYIEEEPCVTRLIQCSISLFCYTQAVALCQMTKNLNYTIAVKQLNERVCHDCCDDLYECIWNVTLLEYIINIHARRGEVERRTKVIQLIGQLELNENNPDEILREAEHVRRGRLMRIMSNKYL